MSSALAAATSTLVTELSFDIDERFQKIPCASMKLISAFTLVSTVVLATPNSNAPSRHEEPVAPTALIGRGKPKPRLITSDLSARDLQFITSTIDLRSTLVFLARQTNQAQSPNLRSLGEELQKNLPSQTAVLMTLAEMRKVAVPEVSSRQQALEKKLSSVKGTRFEKALLDALIDTNQELVNTCEAGLRSTDKSTQQFAEQTVPYARRTLARVQTMAGIAPRRSAETAVLPPIATGPKAPKPGAPKPGFRTNIPSDDAAK